MEYGTSVAPHFGRCKDKINDKQPVPESSTLLGPLGGIAGLGRGL